MNQSKSQHVGKDWTITIKPARNTDTAPLVGTIDGKPAMLQGDVWVVIDSVTPEAGREALRRWLSYSLVDNLKNDFGNMTVDFGTHPILPKQFHHQEITLRQLIETILSGLIKEIGIAEPAQAEEPK